MSSSLITLPRLTRAVCLMQTACDSCVGCQACHPVGYAVKSLRACCCCHNSSDARTACGPSTTCVFICSFVFMNFLACVWYYVATIEGLDNSWLTSVGRSTVI